MHSAALHMAVFLMAQVMFGSSFACDAAAEHIPCPATLVVIIRLHFPKVNCQKQPKKKSPPCQSFVTFHKGVSRLFHGLLRETPLFFRHFPCFPKWLYFYAVYDTINKNLSVFGGDSHGSGRSLRSCRIPHFPKEGAPCAAARRPPDGRCARAGRRKSMGQVHRKIIGRAPAAHLFRKKTPRRRAAGARRGAGRGGRETALSN